MKTIRQRLAAESDPVRAAHHLRFFRTGPGEYGEGDRFRGLTVPRVRAIAREYRDLPLREWSRLLDSPWHEDRLTALIIAVEQFRRGDAARRKAIHELYLSRTDRINNWDLVDLSAPAIVGEYLKGRSRAPLRRLARSRSLWERRIAMLATAAFLRDGELAPTAEIAKMLLRDEHDLIHKAVGWMLREMGKRDGAALRRFLDEHAPRMPRTALRYAIERFPPAERKRYLAIRRR
jgi:3-methyladenine DNA glycosylase AlkD